MSKRSMEKTSRLNNLSTELIHAAIDDKQIKDYSVNHSTRYYFEQESRGILRSLNFSSKKLALTPSTRDILRWKTQAQKLKTSKYHDKSPQRSEGWYKFRRERLTASDIGTILGSNTYGCPEEVIIKKCGVDTYNWSPACEHGIKYEPITTILYANRNRTNVWEYGCISHPKYKFIGASPDGITDEGIMVEIKNPYSRTITGIPKMSYYDQMQIQLEVCDLEICDFVETSIKEYDSYGDYLKDADKNDPHGFLTKRGNLKGVLIEYRVKNGDSTPSYAYKYYQDIESGSNENLYIGVDEYNKWSEKVIIELGSREDVVSVKPIYWRLSKYSCRRIYRNREWFKNYAVKILSDFWKKVLATKNDQKKLQEAINTYKSFDEVKALRFQSISNEDIIGVRRTDKMKKDNAFDCGFGSSSEDDE